MSQTAGPSSLPAVPAATSVAFPLDAFYAREGQPLPRIEVVTADAVPEPFRTLLVHENDMTPTLEAFYRSDLHIEVWGCARQGSDYYREVVLRSDTDGRAVEFGANKINLALFEPMVQRLILDEYLPLGRILKVRGVPHYGRPAAFLRVESDTLMNRAFGLRGRHVLFGRRNTLWDWHGRVLSEVVEILPPATGPGPRSAAHQSE